MADELTYVRPSSSHTCDRESNFKTNLELVLPADPDVPEVVTYRLYKRRFVGITGLVLLNIVAGMTWPWFGPISNNMVQDFGISLDQVNWLGNIVQCVYMPTALLIPIFCTRYGIRRCCDIGAVTLLISGWVRYAGTSLSLSREGAYALLIVGQLFSSISQPIFQVLGPKYSETWYDLRGRTTATMVVAISNPVGCALGQLLSPLVGNSRQSILVLGIISTAVVPATFLIGAAPPTPPTYAGSRKSPTLSSLIRAMVGRERTSEAYMSRRERFDFAILTFVFGVLVAASNAFSLLTDEILAPAGYSDDTAGLMGATLLLTGIVAAIITAPLFDRVLTHHLAITVKVLAPVLAIAWLSLIWAVKPHNTGGLYAIMTIIGTSGVTVLPVGLELGCELTRNADGSSAFLWFSGNLFGLIFVIIQGALRAGPDADPPLNMRKALIFNGAFAMATAALIFLLRGKQARRELDEQKERAQPLATDDKEEQQVA